MDSTTASCTYLTTMRVKKAGRCAAARSVGGAPIRHIAVAGLVTAGGAWIWHGVAVAGRSTKGSVSSILLRSYCVCTRMKVGHRASVS
jgi:hypothetical protein